MCGAVNLKCMFSINGVRSACQLLCMCTAFDLNGFCVPLINYLWPLSDQCDTYISLFHVSW